MKENKLISVLSEVSHMQASQSLKIFLLAGVKTTPSAFYSLEEALKLFIKQKGITPDIELLFPYGEAERSLMRQLFEVRSDLSNRAKLAGFGGRKVWHRIDKHRAIPRLLLIGHSGGGVAAYQIARKLFEDSQPIETKVIQIGSPKTRIIPQLRNQVGYIHSIDDGGAMNDPITRLGTWGGWRSDLMPFPRPTWDSNKFAPGFVQGVKTIGGHADYFRVSDQFRDEMQLCNLEKTMTGVTSYLNEWL